MVDIGGVQAGKSKFQFLMQSPTTAPLTLVIRDHEYLLAAAANKDLSICILEKGAQVGAHILSGAVLEPISLKELLPENWQEAPPLCLLP